MYDIIGDIHGYAEDLIKLLEKMGYKKHKDVYKHPERTAIFVGDFIDRGPKIKEVIQIVKSMHKHKSAFAILGNHEINALGYHTNCEKNLPFKKHTKRSTEQHKETILQFKENQKEWEETLNWFWSLPIFLDLKDIRIVHACWNPEVIKELPDGNISKNIIKNYFRKNEYSILKEITCGIEIKLPKEYKFIDLKGLKHSNIRIAWWKPLKGSTYQNAIFPKKSGITPDLKIPENKIPKIKKYSEKEKPIFFGHYWLSNENYPREPITSNIVCLDYSVAKNGNLTAYRWDGENKLCKSKFIFA